MIDLEKMAIRVQVEGILKQRNILDESIIVAYRGSIAHGMYIENSNPDSIDDIDIMCVCIPSIEYYFGLKNWGSRGTKEFWERDYDVVCYEIKKIVSLLLNCNPNVLSLLYLDEDMYIRKTPVGQMLIDNRDLFLSKKAYNAFCGYAHAQVKGMTKGMYAGYMGAKRKELVDKIGYDSKAASHVIRLLKMGIEYLKEGTLNVNRDGIDAKELLAIKNGRWKIEDIYQMSDDLFEQADEAYRYSKLPEEPDHEKINKLLVDMIVDNIGIKYLGERNEKNI